MFDAVIEAPFGKVGVRVDVAADLVREIVFVPTSMKTLAPHQPLAKRVVQQLERYFVRPSTTFKLPLAEVGSPFQRRVWQAISEIPLGAVTTYGGIAKSISSAPRAVGQACGANFFPLLIPCHRVVSSSGMGGFAKQVDDDYWLSIKRWLLAHEGVAAYAE